MKFFYVGSDDHGGPCAGDVEAPGLVEAAHKLRTEKIEVASLNAASPPPAEPHLADGDAFVFFNRCLADMSRAGIPLSRSIGAIARDAGRGRMRAALKRVEAALREGRPLDEALAKEESLFPTPYRLLVRAGLAAGNLPDVLRAAAAQSSAVRNFRRSLATALAYPIFVLILGFGVSMALARMMVPLYRDICATLQWKEPPGLRLADALVSTAMGPAVIVGLVVAAAVAAGLWIKRTSSGERFLWRLPFVGRVVRGICTVRFLGALRILLDARVPVSQAVPVAASTSDSLRWAGSAELMERALREGRPLNDALAMMEGLPTPILKRLPAAERGSRLGESVGWAEDHWMEQTSAALGSLSKIVEPLALVFVGVAIAALFLTLVCPYFLLFKNAIG